MIEDRVLSAIHDLQHSFEDSGLAMWARHRHNAADGSRTVRQHDLVAGTECPHQFGELRLCLLDGNCADHGPLSLPDWDGSSEVTADASAER
jgi:hypothetical protein